MYFGDGWPYFSRERAVVLLLALLGLGWLLIQLGGTGNEARVSMWRGLPSTTQSGAGGLVGAAAPQVGRGGTLALRPQGNPLGVANAVMTQGYGIGTHAPAEVWGAIDLAVDGDGDGSADPGPSIGTPIYATHSGVVKVTPESYPAGNHIWVSNDEYRTGYSHLQGFAVSNGQQVNAGDIIGYLGSSGMSSGPHLDYQVWINQGGVWVNVNPLEFNALGGLR